MQQINDTLVIQMLVALQESPYITAATIIAVSLMTIFQKNLVLLVKHFFFRGKAAMLNTQPIFILKNHDVFNALIRASNEVKVMKFYTHKEYDKVKSRMCYDFTKHKAHHCKLHMIRVINTKDIDTMPIDALRSLITESQNMMHNDYIAAIRADWLDRGIDSSDVDHVVYLFEKFRYDVVNSFDHRITSVFGSGFHKTNFEIVLAIYDMWAMGVDLLPRDMNTTFESLNGKFQNIKY